MTLYVISKILTAFLLPPGLFITLLLVGSIFLQKGRKLLWALGGSIYLLSINPVANGLLLPLEAPYRHEVLPERVDAVVMLGGGVVEGSQKLPLSDEAFKRALYALSLAKRFDRPLVVSGGGLNEARYSEVQGFFDTLKDLEPLTGPLPKRCPFYVRRFCILPEERSLDTAQNALYTKRLLPDGAKILLVSSAYHLKRATALFALQEINVVPAATDFFVEERPLNWLDLLPNIGALHNSYRALHEYAGMLKVLGRRLAR